MEHSHFWGTCHLSGILKAWDTTVNASETVLASSSLYSTVGERKTNQGSVGSICCVTQHLRLGGLKADTSHSSASSRPRCRPVRFLVRALFLTCGQLPSRHVLSLCLPLLVKPLTPSQGTHLMPSSNPNAIMLGLGLQHLNLGHEGGIVPSTAVGDLITKTVIGEVSQGREGQCSLWGWSLRS